MVMIEGAYHFEWSGPAHTRGYDKPGRGPELSGFFRGTTESPLSDTSTVCPKQLRYRLTLRPALNLTDCLKNKCCLINAPGTTPGPDIRAIVDLRVGNYMTNKPALLVFYGLIIANVTVWVSLAVTML